MVGDLAACDERCHDRAYEDLGRVEEAADPVGDARQAAARELADVLREPGHADVPDDAEPDDDREGAGDRSSEPASTRASPTSRPPASSSRGRPPAIGFGCLGWRWKIRRYQGTFARRRPARSRGWCRIGGRTCAWRRWPRRSWRRCGRRAARRDGRPSRRASAARRPGPSGGARPAGRRPAVGPRRPLRDRRRRGAGPEAAAAGDGRPGVPARPAPAWPRRTPGPDGAGTGRPNRRRWRGRCDRSRLAEGASLRARRDRARGRGRVVGRRRRARSRLAAAVGREPRGPGCSTSIFDGPPRRAIGGAGGVGAGVSARVPPLRSASAGLGLRHGSRRPRPRRRAEVESVRDGPPRRAIGAAGGAGSGSIEVSASSRTSGSAARRPRRQ